MSEFKNKNDYSVTVYLNSEKRLFQEFVHSPYIFTQWLAKQAIQWDYILVYVRRSRAVLCYYKNGDFIDSKPNFTIRGRIKQGW
ncbi:hypothetical protein SAMN05444366_1266 [Flavobacterium saccharophilum]|uniref:Uncharacterized protein n=1 Tax=Flavobacterium saccharophilum TaxID=29534 RepID=A0A1M7CSS1_9FLAO|nr:hypothetical protein SAMN05444366_1266 [Flavobacterium saccharophilum]